jgi:preprotein translocase subunit SecD
VKGKTMLTKQQILEANDLKTETVFVPEWGGDVNVRTLTGKELDAYEMSFVGDGKSKMQNIRARLIVRAVVDEQGQRLFSDADAEAIGERSGLALDRVYAVAARLNGRTDKEQKELEKNSEAVHTGDLSFDLPPISE